MKDFIYKDGSNMKKVLIIAEAGVNHNGSLEIAKKMVDVVVESGADIIKFQTANPEKVISKYAPKAEYQKKAMGEEDSQLEMVKKITLPNKDFIELKEYCDEKKIRFLSTPFDIESIDFLNELGIDLWKIPSGEITNYPYLVSIAKTKKPIIVSTGMSNMEEIEAALALLKTNGAGEISILHCNTQYPTPYEDVNLKAMETIHKDTGLEVGYSDHTLGIEVPIAAVAMGATIIEKHFTLDRNMEGPDHKASLEPDELKAMVLAIRHIELSKGSAQKCVSPSERANIVVARKSIIAAKDIKKGEKFSEENLTTKRPGDGISPMHWNEILGTIAIRDFSEDEKIEI